MNNPRAIRGGGLYLVAARRRANLVLALRHALNFWTCRSLAESGLTDDEAARRMVDVVGADHRNAPVNALGYLRVMFAVDDIDETLARLRKHGAELVSSEVVQYEDAYRLCYIRGPGGLLIGLAQELG